MSLALPTIHTNGTHPDSLLEQYGDARLAVMKAIEALQKAHPNGRDYYPQGSDAIRRAEAEQRARLESLTSVKKELEEIMDAIMDAAKERRR